ncbi:MAG: type VI secretion system contractile sheath large subunit [Pirellulaceae bacterium]
MASEGFVFSEVKVGASLAPAGEGRGAKDPFHLLLIGNFRGSHPDTSAPLGKPIVVDRDNFYELPGQLGTRIDGMLASSDGQTESISFEELEDFEPDRLFERLALFENLRTLRRRLKNPKLFEAAAAEVLAWEKVAWDKGAGGQGSAEDPSPPPEMRAEYSTAELFENVLTESADAERSPLESGNWNRLIQNIVSESKVQRIDPREESLVALVDQAIEGTMRQLLHGPAFRSLETTWLGLQMMVRRVETHAKLKIHIVDISSERFREALDSDDIAQTELGKLILAPSQTPGATPWAVVGALFPFSTSEEDLRAVHRFGALASAAGAAGLVEIGGSQKFWLDPDQVEATPWGQLRQQPAAKSLAAIWPRFLSRLPYGRKTRPTERFVFEEIPPGSPPRLVWGSPVWLGAVALAEAFNTRGWDMQSGIVHQIEELPLYYIDTDDAEIHPCGQYLLSDTELEKIAAQGLTPVVSFKNQDRIQLRGIQSIRGGKLSGPWE